MRPPKVSWALSTTPTLPDGLATQPPGPGESAEETRLCRSCPQNRLRRAGSDAEDLGLRASGLPGSCPCLLANTLPASIRLRAGPRSAQVLPARRCPWPSSLPAALNPAPTPFFAKAKPRLPGPSGSPRPPALRGRPLQAGRLIAGAASRSTSDCTSGPPSSRPGCQGNNPSLVLR